MEQTFSLLFQSKFLLTTEDASLKAGLVLMWAGFLGAVIQGGLIRRLVARFGERKLLMAGQILSAASMAVFPFIPTYELYYFVIIPMATGSALINPSLSALISKNALATEQGATLGLSQGLGSLARAAGPFCGLLTFTIHPAYPYAVATAISLVLVIFIYMLRPRFTESE